ncbi:response regulator [Paenibacillus sp. JCM 10914]
MRVWLIDDEMLALSKLKKMLLQCEGSAELEWIGEYQNPYDALAAARLEAPDVVFLDIQMPELTGFELAEKLWELHPQLHIVFVTAYHEYAIKAFEVNALDYLLKPVLSSRLAVTWDRIVRATPLKPRLVSGTADEHTTLCCLQSLHYRDKHGQTNYFPWKTLKAPELFAYLIYYREKMVSKQALMDLLWPDQEPKKAATQLHTAIYQIRSMIRACGLDGQIHYHDDGYRLELQVKLDVEKWEDRLRNAPGISPDTLPLHQSIMDMYTGDFLADHRYVWAEPEQERIRLLWLEHAKSMAACHIMLDQYSESVRIYQQAIEKLPYLEDGYVELMQLYASMHHHSEVRKLFQQMRAVLLGEYEIPLSEHIVRWYREWEESLEVLELERG